MLGSTAITLSAIYYSYDLHQQFYPTVLYLSTNKINRTILFNFALMLLSKFIMSFIVLMFGEIREIEKISVIDKTKRKILEIAYLLFFFNDQLDWQFLFLMMGLIGLSIVHWVTIKRANYLIAESQLRMKAHIKLILCFILLLYVDVKITTHFFYYSEEKFQNMLFAFEFLLLPIKLALPAIKYAINLFEILTYSQFEMKQTLFSALDVIFTMLKMSVQLMLVRYVWLTQGFLLYLFMDAIENCFGLIKEIRVFYNQMKLVRIIDKIEDVDKIDRNDNICLICLHELESGKKLQCGHVFHKHCIKTWIQGNPNQFCPKCKQPIQIQENVEHEITKIKTQIVYSEMITLKNTSVLLDIVQKFRILQNHHQNSDGIGAVSYGLPCEAVYQPTTTSELRRLQINQMNTIILGLQEGQIESHQIQFDEVDNHIRGSLLLNQLKKMQQERNQQAADNKQE